MSKKLEQRRNCLCVFAVRMRAGWPCIYRPAVGEGSRDDLGWPISIACACDLCVNQLHAGSELFETGSNM